MPYLHIHVHLDRIGDAFDDIRKNDDRLRWVGFAARSPRGTTVAGINPMKALTRDRLENYVDDCLKGRVIKDRDGIEGMTFYFIIDDKPGMDEYATELALRFGNGIARRSTSTGM